jgi:hypothetical protein
MEVVLGQVGRHHHASHCSNEAEDGVCKQFELLAGGEMRDSNYSIRITNPDAPSCCLASKLRVPGVTGGDFTLKSKSSESPEDAVRVWNPSCFDTLDTVEAEYVNLLQNAIGDVVDPTACGGSCGFQTPMCNASQGRCIVPTCADVKANGFCRESSLRGVRARQVCPQTCGCSEPRSPLALFAPRGGCGDKCMVAGEYRAARAALSCADVATDDPDFQALLDDFDAVRKAWPVDFSQYLGVLVSILRREGCDFLAIGTDRLSLSSLGPEEFSPYVFGLNLCVEGGSYWPIKPLSYFCPVACGCRGGDPHCPDSCPARTADTPTCPEWQQSYANSYPESTSCANAIV